MEGRQTSFINIKVPLHPLKPRTLPELSNSDEEEVHYIQQFVSEVVDFSSQYGSEFSISYTAYNLTGKPSKFPDYGDFPQAFVMKTYGDWWKEAPSRTLEYMPQNTIISSNDYVDVAFEEAVYPFTVSIYETYNPGAVVRIWAQKELPDLKIKWCLLWEGDLMTTAQAPRIFTPVIKVINTKTKSLRIEFNHSKLEYYTGIDAVLLVGTKEPVQELDNHKMVSTVLALNKYDTQLKYISDINGISSHQNKRPVIVLGKITQKVLNLNLHNFSNEHHDLQTIVENFQVKKGIEHVLDTGTSTGNTNGWFKCLPDETVLKILSYLDLKSLLRVAKLNKHFSVLVSDPFLYTQLSLNPYWHCFTNSSLSSLTDKCQFLQKLDLSWCGNYNMIDSENVISFIVNCGKNLTNLRLNCCKFVNNTVIKSISDTCENLREIGLRNCTNVQEAGYLHMTNLTQLEYLDVYRTVITTPALIAILRSNNNLKHLNVGACTKILNMDDVALALATYNKQLRSVDFWKICYLSHVGVRHLSACSQLEEIDFGWCLGLGLSVDCVSSIAYGCPNLKKLFLCALRGINDLEPFTKHCKMLEQLDLLGVRSVSPDMCLKRKLDVLDFIGTNCENFMNIIGWTWVIYLRYRPVVTTLLVNLPRLRLLDLSFCDQISDTQVSNWKMLFPNVSIKRSFQTEGSSRNITYY